VRRPVGIVTGVLDDLYCPECGAGLYRGPTSWICPVGPDHTKLIADSLVAQVVRGAVAKAGRLGEFEAIWKEVLRLGRANEIPAVVIKPNRRSRNRG
jgi:hypothetical protein